MSDVKEPRVKVKEVEHAILWSDASISLKCVRISHPHFWKPYKEGGKFSVYGLMPKKKIYLPAHDLVQGEIDKILKEKKLPGLPSDRYFIRDGKDRPDRPEWQGYWVVSASEQKRPPLRDAKMQPILAEDSGERLYGGAWMNLLIRPWYQDHVEGGKRVNANLLGVQYVPISTVRKFIPDASDEAFGSGRISDEAIDDSFGVIDDDDSGYDDKEYEGL